MILIIKCIIFIIIIIKLTQHQTTCKDSELFNQLLPKIPCMFMLLFASDHYQRLSVACFHIHSFIIHLGHQLMMHLIHKKYTSIYLACTASSFLIYYKAML